MELASLISLGDKLRRRAGEIDIGDELITGEVMVQKFKRRSHSPIILRVAVLKQTGLCVPHTCTHGF